MTEDGHYLGIHVSQGSDRRNRFFYRDLQDPDGKVVELLNDFDAAYDFIGNVGTMFYFKTDLDAPRGRVIAIDITQAGADELAGNHSPKRRRAGRGVAGERPVHRELFEGRAFGGEDFRARREICARRWNCRDWEARAGSAGSARTRRRFIRSPASRMPATIYRYDLTTGTSTVFRQPKMPFNSADYETKQMFYHSKDGTRVPMFITSRKGTKLDGNNPTYLYGYGGFDISITPSFSPAMAAWLEMGGVFAVANIRGGGEYGEEWHQAGMKLKKQNVFDDFIAAGGMADRRTITRGARNWRLAAAAMAACWSARA